MRDKKTRANEPSQSEMANSALPVGWKELTIQISPQMEELLKTLLSTGLYGFSIEDSAERILAADLHQRFLRR